MAGPNDSDSNRLLADTDTMQRFTATGRPYKPPTKAEKNQAALSNIGADDTMFGTAPNLVPFRYTDDSLISVPVLRPEDFAGYPQRAAEALAAEKNDGTKKKFWKSRRASKDGGLNENFVIKKVPRGEYLKHYAKDEEGRFVGTSEPAADCLLRGPDLERWRGAGGGITGSGGFRNEAGGMSLASTLVNGGVGRWSHSVIIYTKGQGYSENPDQNLPYPAPVPYQITPIILGISAW